MSTIVNMVLSDLLAVPTTQTFAVTQVAPNAVYRATSTTVPLAGQATVNLQVKQSQTSDGMNRVKATIRVPVMEAVLNQNAAGYTAAPRVAYVCTGEIDLILPNRSSATQRQVLMGLLQSMMTHVNVQDAVINLAKPY